MPTLPTGQNVSADEFKRYWTNIFQNDPEMQRIFADITSPDYAQRSGQQRATALAEVQRRRAAGEPVDAALSYAAYGGGDFGGEQHREIAARDRASALGFVPQDDWSLDFDQGGFRVERENFINRNKEWLIPAAVGGVGVAGGLGAFGGAAGSAAAGGGAASSSAAVPAAGATLGPGVGFGAGGVPVGTTLGGTTMATAAPAAAGGIGAGGLATAAGSSLPSWVKLAAGFGSDALKTYLGNRASGQANAQLQAGGDKAIGVFKDALSPYMNLGGQAAGNLGFLMGTGPLPSQGGQGAPPASAVPPTYTGSGRTMPDGGMVTGQAGPRPSPLPPIAMPPPYSEPYGYTGTLGGRSDPAQAMSQSSYVRMTAPDGEEGEVPEARVSDALSNGFRMAVGRG